MNGRDDETLHDSHGGGSPPVDRHRHAAGHPPHAGARRHGPMDAVSPARCGGVPRRGGTPALDSSRRRRRGAGRGHSGDGVPIGPGGRRPTGKPRPPSGVGAAAPKCGDPECGGGGCHGQGRRDAAREVALFEPSHDCACRLYSNRYSPLLEGARLHPLEPARPSSCGDGCCGDWRPGATALHPSRKTLCAGSLLRRAFEGSRHRVATVLGMRHGHGEPDDVGWNYWASATVTILAGLLLCLAATALYVTVFGFTLN